jgi:hypothetical protein
MAPPNTLSKCEASAIAKYNQSLSRSNIEPEEGTLPCEAMLSSDRYCYFGRNGTTTTTLATKHLRRSVTVRPIDDVRFIAAITTFRLKLPSWHRREKEKEKKREGVDGMATKLKSVSRLERRKLKKKEPRESSANPHRLRLINT